MKKNGSMCSPPRDPMPMTREDVEGSIIRRLDAVIARYPANIAVDDGNHRHSYAEFDQRIDQLAAVILARADAAPQPVALLLNAPFSFYCALFAVLRAGKFYAALDTGLAPDGLAAIARNLDTRLLLCDHAHHALALLVASELPDCRVINVDGVRADRWTGQVRIPTGADDIACIVYTSGSTRSPEGVVITQRAILHFVMNHTNTLRIGPVDRGSQLCPFTSAACCGEIFPILLNGGALLPYSVKEQGSGALPRWLRQGRVTIYTSVPALFRLLTSAAGAHALFPDVRVVKLSGDRILASDVEAFKAHFSRDCLFRASLGAAEALLYTQFVTGHDYESEGAVVPAGYPLQDMEVFIVDEDMTRLGPGETGEIAVKSRYLSSGYWRNEALTAERFLRSERDGEARTYLSRDLGVMRADGCLVHLGRKDFRAKIHGRMVPLDEIEEALLDFPGIADIAVVALNDGDSEENRLAAFYVTRDGIRVDPLSLRRELLSLFTPEAVPGRFIELESLPLTPGNKVDRRALLAWRPLRDERPVSSSPETNAPTGR